MATFNVFEKLAGGGAAFGRRTDLRRSVTVCDACSVQPEWR